MTAAALRRIVRPELRPDFLRHLEPQSFVLRGRVELAGQVPPHFCIRLNMPPQTRQQCRRHVAIAAARLNAEHVGGMRAGLQFPEGGIHLVTRGAERIGLRKFEAADEASRKADADDEGEQAAGRNTEQKPAPRTPPKPCGKTLNRLRRIHCEVPDAVMSSPSSQSENPIDLDNRFRVDRERQKNGTRPVDSSSVRFRTDPPVIAGYFAGRCGPLCAQGPSK